MPAFTDSTGEQWTIHVDIATIARIRATLNVNFADLGGDGTPPIMRFNSDLMFAVDVLYVACQPRCRELGLSDIQFAERLGDSLQEGMDAFQDSLRDFFRRNGMSVAIRAMEKQKALLKGGLDIWERRIGAVDLGPMLAEIEAEAEKIMQPGATLSSQSAGDSDSPTPDP